MPLQVELSQPEDSGAVPTWSHKSCPALQFPLEKLVEMLLKGNGHLSVQHRPALLLVLPVSDEAGSNVDPVCSVPSYPITVRCFRSQVNTFWSSLDKMSLSAGQSWFYLYVLFFD